MKGFFAAPFGNDTMPFFKIGLRSFMRQTCADVLRVAESLTCHDILRR
ncbi:hypothetical protein [Pantoea agglomerans]|nr:hypothetical protein [Pantoea agglomerans]